MPIIVPAGFAQVTFQYSAATALGSKVAFTFGLGRAPSADLGDAIKIWWDAQLKPLTSAHYVLETIRMRSDVGEADTTVNEAGTITGDTSPPNVAVLVQKRTGLAGRSNRGRMFLPGLLPDTSTDNGGTISPTRLDAIQAAVNDLRARADADWGGVQLFHNGSSDPTTVTSLPVLQQVATQRRRMRK